MMIVMENGGMVEVMRVMFVTEALHGVRES